MMYLLLLLPALQDLRELVDRLGSDRIEERDDAAREIRRRGRPGLAELEKAARDADPEVAGRALRLIRLIRGVDTLTPRLLKAFPKIEERLATGTDGDWTETFLAAFQADLKREDLEPLAERALRGAVTGEEKAAICIAVGELDLTPALLETVNLLKDDNVIVHSAAVCVLRRRRTKQTIPAITTLLKHRDEGVRIRAIDLLADLDVKDAVPSITKLLGDRAGGVRGIAAGALAQLEGKAATPKLLFLIKFDPAPWVRLQALQALERVRGAEAVPVILGLLKDREATVREGSLELLGSLKAREVGPEIVKTLRDPSAKVRRLAIHILLHLELSAYREDLLSLLHDADAEVRATAAGALGSWGVKKAIPGLHGLLTDRSADVRCNAVQSLGLMGARESGAAILHLLDDEDPEVRDTAVTVLGWMEVREAAPRIARLLKEDHRRHRRERMLGVLADLQEKESVPEILELLGDPDLSVVRTALETLGALGDRRAVPRIEAFLEGCDEESLDRAVVALSDLKATESVPLLLKKLEHAGCRSSTKDRIRWALANMGARETAPRILSLLRNKGTADPGSAPLVLGWMGAKEAVPDLINLLQDRDEHLAGYAALGLAQLAATEAIPSIALLLEKTDSRADTAAYALARLEARDRIPALSKALTRWKGESQVPFAHTLVSLGSAEGVSVLLEHGKFLGVLNALRLSEEWKRLGRLHLSRTPRGVSIDDFLRIIEKESSLAVDWPGNPYQGLGLQDRVLTRQPNWTARISLVDAMEEAVGYGRFGFILEPGKIRILPRSEALTFWRAWWEAEPRR